VKGREGKGGTRFVPSQICQSVSRSRVFWFLGSKMNGKAVDVLLHIAAARLIKSID
jgi:hypothetical protein